MCSRRDPCFDTPPSEDTGSRSNRSMEPRRHNRHRPSPLRTHMCSCRDPCFDTPPSEDTGSRAKRNIEVEKIVHFV